MSTRMTQVRVAASVLVDQMDGGTEGSVVAEYAHMFANLFATAWQKPEDKLLGLLRAECRKIISSRKED